MLGCGLGHLKIWDIIKEIQDDIIDIILEDDTIVYFDKLDSLLLYEIKNILEILDSKDYSKNSKNSKNKEFGILQLSGASFLTKSEFELNNNYSIINSKIHFTLGAYIVSKKSARYLSDNIILNYHIDFMLNTLKINNYIIQPQIANQYGWSDSTMCDKKYKVINKTNDNIKYSLTLPLMCFNDIIITFLFLFWIILFCTLLVFKIEPIIWILCGFLFFESISIQ